MEITKEADGILLAFSKEVDAPDVVGKAIGSGLRKALNRINVPAPERIVLLNDTAATLLSGISQISVNDGLYHGAGAGPTIGFILGTGVNTAYPETCIPKINFDSLENPQIVVCESGSFAHNYVGFLDSEFDKSTQSPGAYTLEKAVAGAYLGPLTFHIIKRALTDGLFAFNKADEFFTWPRMGTKDLNAFLHEPLSRPGPVGELFAENERSAMMSFAYLATIVTERAALLSAGLLAAAAEKASRGYGSSSPVRIAVDGSTYSFFKGMRKALDAHLHVMLNRNKPRFYAIAPVEQASLLGAAVAALA
jgi:hexokinase